MNTTSNPSLTAHIDKNSTHRVSNIIQIKVNKMKKSASGQLSARPSRSVIRSKSLFGPTVGKTQK